MILLTSDIRCRDDRDVILIEGITLFSYDLNYGWISLILRIFHSLFVISVFVVLADLENISVFHDWFLTISVNQL